MPSKTARNSRDSFSPSRCYVAQTNPHARFGSVNQMGISFHVGTFDADIGTPSFLHAFFSTIRGRLEPNGWGTRFPKVMGPLYQGELTANDAPGVTMELRVIRQELKRFLPSKVIWDIEQPQLRPPWGDQISPEITDLSNYFVTSEGRDLFEVIEECLVELQRVGGMMTIE